MKTDIEIRKTIMQRVYLTYFLRQAGNPLVRVAVLGVAALSSLSFVSVQKVIANVSGTQDVIRFFTSAFVNTELLVQVAVLIAAAIIVWSLVDLLRQVTHTRQYA